MIYLAIAIAAFIAGGICGFLLGLAALLDTKMRIDDARVQGRNVLP